MNARKILGSFALVGVVAASGSAFTASNTMAADAVKGYGSQSISGVAATSVTYNTDATGATIETVGLVLTGDTTAKTIQIAFNDAAPATCSGDATAAYLDPSTTYSCTITGGLAVGDATKFALVAV